MAIFSPIPAKEYVCLKNLDLYDSSQCTQLSTQAGQGRHLILLEQVQDQWLVKLCEDDYQAWLSCQDLMSIQESTDPYQASVIERVEIERRLGSVLEFALLAGQQDNFYLWGGTVGPNYDCSGLIQSAFASAGIWLPRNSYQQEEFTTRIAVSELIAGDLIFFGSIKINHVALYLGQGNYIHSSGGRKGIEIDHLWEDKDEVAKKYNREIVSYGRVERGYLPKLQ